MSVAEVSVLDALGYTVLDEVGVISCSLNALVDQCCNGVFPAFLNLDIEGLDIQVLQHARFNTRPHVICVETRPKDSAVMEHLMQGKGFKLYCRMGENHIYVQAGLEHYIDSGELRDLAKESSDG
jgi:hypothetical protein